MEYSVPFVLLIGEYAFDSTLCQTRFAGGGRHAFFSDVLGNTIRGFALKKELIDNRTTLASFSTIYHIVFYLFVAKKLTIWKPFLSVSKPLSLAPRDVLTD